MTSTECEPVMEVRELSHQWGGGFAPGRELWVEAPLVKLKAF